jgi:fused signal recognition particle receptor
MALFGLFNKDKKKTLDRGLEKSSQSFLSKLGKAIVGKSKVDEEVLDNLEEILITSDVGVDTTVKIIERIEQRVAKDKFLGTKELDEILREEITFLLAQNETSDFDDFTLSKTNQPYVLMVVGVNGVGKTTTIGKLANQF